MRSLQILWISPVINSESVIKHKGVSAAANVWQLNFIHALTKLGHKVEIITYLVERVWPFGKLIPALEESEAPTNQSSRLRYLNLPLVREHSLLFQHKKLLQKNFKTNEFDLAITFNEPFHNIALAQYLKETGTAKSWISILADDDSSNQSDGLIYLSQSSFQKSDFQLKFLFEGGIPSFQGVPYTTIDKKILLYAGDFSDLAGIKVFTEQFISLDPAGMELHIYGRGDGKVLEDLAQQNDKIKFIGFVDQDVLKSGMGQAYAFINPRNEELDFKLNTFPSKMLEYLSFGKPILSTQLKSVPSRYNQFLVLYQSNDIESLRKGIQQISDMTIEDYCIFAEEAKNLCINNSWSKRVEEVMNQIYNKVLTN